MTVDTKVPKMVSNYSGIETVQPTPNTGVSDLNDYEYRQNEVRVGYSCARTYGYFCGLWACPAIPVMGVE